MSPFPVNVSFSQGNECVAMDTRQRMNGNQNVHCDGTLMTLTINCHQIFSDMRMRLTADKQKSKYTNKVGENKCYKRV